MTDAAKPLGPMPRAIRVRNVNTDELKPNPHNPRYLFDREPLKTLRESILKVGILVPLTVYRAKGSANYTILDGQRRWMCAQELGLEKIPINEVEEPSTAQNIVTMFQIHKLRRDWELMPTALKVQVLIDEINEKRNEHLASITGLDVAMVVRCKKLLWYPKKYQQMMLFVEPTSRVKADFFIELYPVVTDRELKKADWYSRNEIIDRMLAKYQTGGSGIKAITDFRRIKQYMTAAAKADVSPKLLKRFREFLADDKLPISHLEISSATIQRRARNLARSVTKILDDLSKMEVGEFYGEEDLWESLEELFQLLRKKIKQADRRLP
jgi:ParB family transcriptional regulator, chromosome partitioning protein